MKCTDIWFVIICDIAFELVSFFVTHVHLLRSGREYFEANAKTPLHNEMRRALEARVRTLVEVSGR